MSIPNNFIRREEQVSILISLTKEEALWLKEYMRTPRDLEGMESPIDAEMRMKFFHGLTEAKV